MEEITIKVPAPFSGVSDLGFTARYPGQEAYSAAPDVPLLIEGPAALVDAPYEVAERRLASLCGRVEAHAF